MGTKTGAFQEEEEEEKKRRKREGTKINRYLPSKRKNGSNAWTSEKREEQQELADKCQKTKKAGAVKR
jgi:hypothetical protein